MAHTIGEQFGGGIIYYVDETGDHGLICTAEDLGEYNWSAAIKACAELELNGYKDWYLPTITELNLMYQQKNTIGNYKSGYFYQYWSSSENLHNDKFAWLQDFSNGRYYVYKDGDYKASKARVRATRAF